MHIITALSALLLFACNTEPECIDDGQCGDMQACVEEQCRDVDCLSSTDCALHQFCDARAHACREGCNDDEDCKAGEACTDEHTCKSYGCRDTVLDCPIGRVCDEGQCVEWPEPTCTVCDALEEVLGMQPCGPHAACYQLEGGPDVGFCFPECAPPSAEDICPNQFICDEFPDGVDRCFHDCPTLIKNGWL